MVIDTTETVSLSSETLVVVAERLAAVEWPQYDRSYEGPTVAHFGPGSFFRAALQRFYEPLVSAGCSKWMVDVVSMRSMCTPDLLKQQDCLHTVTTSDPFGNLTSRVRGSVRKAYYAGLDCSSTEFRDVLGRVDLAHVLSFTITPDGWPRDLGEERLLADVTILKNLYFENQALGERPFATALGYIAWTLIERWRHGRPAPGLLMFENMKRGGDKMLELLLKILDQADKRVSAAIRSGEYPVAMPIGMGDRIVAEGQVRDSEGKPMVSRECRRLRDEHGVYDPLALLTEDYVSFVVGCLDENGEMLPGTEALRDLQAPGFEFTTPKEAVTAQIKKLLFVNGAHAALALLGAVEGHEVIDRAAAQSSILDVLIARNREVRCILQGSCTDLPQQYERSLMERFGNPALADKVTRVGRRISSKVIDYFLESIKLAGERTLEAKASALLVALWVYYLHLESEGRVPIQLPDKAFIEEHGDWRRHVPAALYLAAIAGHDAGAAQVLVKEVLEAHGKPVFCDRVIECPWFVEVFADTLRALYHDGVAGLTKYGIACTCGES